MAMKKLIIGGLLVLVLLSPLSSFAQATTTLSQSEVNQQLLSIINELMKQVLALMEKLKTVEAQTTETLTTVQSSVNVLNPNTSAVGTTVETEKPVVQAQKRRAERCGELFTKQSSEFEAENPTFFHRDSTEVEGWKNAFQAVSNSIFYVASLLDKGVVMSTTSIMTCSYQSRFSPDQDYNRGFLQGCNDLFNGNPEFVACMLQ